MINPSLGSAKSENSPGMGHLQTDPKSPELRRVAFLPFDSQNPYQRLLAEGLLDHRYHVIPIKGWTDLASQQPEFDVLHVHWTPPISPHPFKFWQRYKSLHSLVRSARRGTPIIWTVHNLIPHDSRHPALDRHFSTRVAKSARSLIAHSPAARSEILRNLGPHFAQKIHTIPHGHYLEAYPNEISRSDARAQLQIPQSETLVLFLGIIRPYKGIPELLDAWTTLDTTHATLLIAGRIPNQLQAEEFRRRINATPKVCLREGFIPDDKLQVYFNAADLVIFPYRQILSSGSVVLAMSFGKFCIAPRIGTVTDLLAGAGSTLFSDGPDALRRALHESIAHPGDMAARGVLNRNRARLWDWKSIATATVAAYDGKPSGTPNQWWMEVE